MTAHAVCAATPPGWQITVDAVQPNTTNPQSRIAWCPTGQVVLGGGLTKSYLGQTGLFRVTGFFPHWSGANVSIEAGSQLPNGLISWATEAWAICADA